MFNNQTDLQLVEKLYHRCVDAGLLFNWSRDHSPEAILQGCRERERYEYDAIARMCHTCKEQGIEADESKFIRQVSSLLEMSANASDEDLHAMVKQTNKHREYFNYTHNLRLSPWAYLVYIAGRDRFLWK